MADIKHWQGVWLEKLRSGEILYIMYSIEKGQKKTTHCEMYLEETNQRGIDLRHNVRIEWIEPLLAVCSPSKGYKTHLVYDESKDSEKPEIAVKPGPEML